MFFLLLLQFSQIEKYLYFCTFHSSFPSMIARKYYNITSVVTFPLSPTEVTLIMRNKNKHSNVTYKALLQALGTLIRYKD